jgi:uncharacterized membrane protein YidH (DUF202 family)
MTSHAASRQAVPAPAVKKPRRLREFFKRHRNASLLVLSIVLIVLAVFLSKELIDKKYAEIYNCNHLVTEPLHTGVFCAGVEFGPFNILGIKIPRITIVPGLNHLDGPLDQLRRFIIRTILVVFALASLFLAFIAGKIKRFIDTVRKPEGRKAILGAVSLFLFIFAVFCSLFYIGVVAR